MIRWRADAVFVTDRGSLFHVDAFTLRIVSKIAVFGTFGVVFPPLAVVITVSLLTYTMLTQLSLGRLLLLQGLRCRESIDRDCEGAVELLWDALFLVLPVASLFYGFFLFDIYGDEAGWKRSCWIPLVMLFVPLVCIVYFYGKRLIAPTHTDRGSIESSRGDLGLSVITSPLSSASNLQLNTMT